ncbi:MAG: hypothetical protein GY754_03845 [bacterium]|nr:hypothetical protein [bacterium]
MRNNKTSTAIVLVSMAFTFFVCGDSTMTTAKSSASGLNPASEIIGPLGKPLGEVITITATVQPDPGKGRANWLKITKVNGKALSKAVTMHYTIFQWAAIKKLTVNKTYTLRVYQDGGMIGIPHQAMKETVFVQTEDYHFAYQVVVLKEK